MESASWERLRDASRCLALADRPGAALYLAGYAAEMALKTACFHLIGGRPADLVGPLLSNVRRQAGMLLQQGTLAHPFGGHDLVFWLDYLGYLRHARGVATWQPAFERRVAGHVLAVASVWTVEMRYHRIRVSRIAAQHSIGRVGWLVRQRQRLRR
jgi:hypothetical protein